MWLATKLLFSTTIVWVAHALDDSLPLPPLTTTPTRPCPVRVFVYELPLAFTNPTNASYLKDMTLYASEQRLHRALQRHPCRTRDPNAADLFYVPVSPSQAAHEHLGRSGADLQRAFDLLQSSLDFISSHFPFYRASNGSDHWFVVAQDVGSCLAPLALSERSHFLQTNGDMSSVEPASAAGLLDYVRMSSPTVSASFQKRLQAAPCFRPGKDLVIPPHFAEREGIALREWSRAAHVHIVPGPRAALAFFRGSVRRDERYSGGIRQWMNRTLTTAAAAALGFEVHFALHRGRDASERYWTELEQAEFCLCPPGWVGWSPRLYQAMAAGCVPVLIGVNMELPFERFIDWDQLVVRVDKGDLSTAENLASVLQAVPQTKRVEMQRSGQRHWRHFTFPRYHQPQLLTAEPGPVWVESSAGATALVLQELALVTSSREGDF